MVILTYGEEETKELGVFLGKQLIEKDVICLEGDLGVGKTIFSKGIAKGLRIEDHIVSPTFTIVNEYEGKIPLYHFDVYRIEDIEEMDELGYEEYFFGNGVCLIEWASKIEEIIPFHCIWITIEKDLNQGFDFRKITVIGKGERYEELSSLLKKRSKEEKI